MSDAAANNAKTHAILLGIVAAHGVAQTFSVHLVHKHFDDCDGSSISDPLTGFKNYLQHVARFLEYLNGRDFCDETSLSCYHRFFRHLAVEDLGNTTDEALGSPLGQLLRDLQAVEETTLTD